MTRAGKAMVGAALALAVAAVPAGAQLQSQSYTFLKAVQERDGDKVTEVLKAPGSNVVNARDDRGDGALHIVAARRDLTYLRFLLAAKPDVNLGNARGDTALLVASRIGFADGVEVLLRAGAQVDKTNRRGETPLIIAVQQRQMPIIRALVAAGANPDRTDNATGRSARDYARQDARGPEMLKLMDAAKPAKAKAVAGPGL